MAISWERAVPLAFPLCSFYFSAVLIVVSLFRLVFRAGCGIRMYRFLIIAFLSNLYIVFYYFHYRGFIIDLVRLVLSTKDHLCPLDSNGIHIQNKYYNLGPYRLRQRKIPTITAPVNITTIGMIIARRGKLLSFSAWIS